MKYLYIILIGMLSYVGLTIFIIKFTSAFEICMAMILILSVGYIYFLYKIYKLLWEEIKS